MNLVVRDVLVKYGIFNDRYRRYVESATIQAQFISTVGCILPSRQGITPGTFFTSFTDPGPSEVISDNLTSPAYDSSVG